MWAISIVGALFLIVAAYSAFGAEADHANAVANAGIGATLVGLSFAIRFHERRADEFDLWLVRNREAIARGGAIYRDIEITPSTVLARYQVAVSLLIVTFKFPTRFYVVGHDSTFWVATACTAVSLLLGWWGLPWGPIYTVQVVARNLRGGIRQIVREELPSSSTVVRP